MQLTVLILVHVTDQHIIRRQQLILKENFYWRGKGIVWNNLRFIFHPSSLENLFKFEIPSAKEEQRKIKISEI